MTTMTPTMTDSAPETRRAKLSEGWTGDSMRLRQPVAGPERPAADPNETGRPHKALQIGVAVLVAVALAVVLAIVVAVVY